MFLCYNEETTELAKYWRVVMSKFNYKKLFKELIDIEMINTELMEK